MQRFSRATVRAGRLLGGNRCAHHRPAVGATALRVPTALPFTASLDGIALPVPERGELVLPAPAAPGHTVTLRFPGTGGRRAGALLDGPVEVDTAPVAAPLRDWNELGLGELGGEVRYSARVLPPALSPGERLVLDLGDVRGSAEVRIDGVRVGSLVWSPYRLDVTQAVGAGGSGTGPCTVEVVVRGTLANPLQAASPTPAVLAGQTRAGLRGPVRLVRTGGGETRQSGGSAIGRETTALLSP